MFRSITYAPARPRGFPLLRWASLFLLLVGMVLLVTEISRYSRFRRSLPPNTVIGGVPVGGLTPEEAVQRLLEVYNRPVELRYGEARIWLDPATIGFTLDTKAMLAAVARVQERRSFWSGFWDFLWGRRPEGVSVPLVAEYSKTRLREYLEREIVARYDRPPRPPQPIVGTTRMQPGEPGTALQIEEAISRIERALFSPSRRVVILPVRQIEPQGPPFANLQVLLEQTVQLADFEGVVGVYFMDLDTGREIHFAYQGQDPVPLPPDIAFTGASIIKIPIMVSVMKRIDLERADPEVLRQMENMIAESGNEAADWLMENVLDPNLGPLLVTEDMRLLGLENTFLAGFFRPGAPLLKRYETPASQRTDVFTDPDPYNQTTPSDMGALLADLYQCANHGGGALQAAFPNEITREECRYMLDLLSTNRIAVLFEAGIPDGTRIDHKHGWVTNFQGYITTMGDAGIIYTPKGDFVLVAFIWHPVQVIWDQGAALLADLAEAVYNFYNPPPTTTSSSSR